MKFEKDNPQNIPNIPGSDVENTRKSVSVIHWTEVIDRTDTPVKPGPPPVDDVPSHESVDLTTDTDDEISKPESGEIEELEKSDEICDTQSTGSILGENGAENTDTDAPDEMAARSRGRPKRKGRRKEPLRVAEALSAHRAAKKLREQQRHQRRRERAKAYG